MLVNIELILRHNTIRQFAASSAELLSRYLSSCDFWDLICSIASDMKFWLYVGFASLNSMTSLNLLSSEVHDPRESRIM